PRLRLDAAAADAFLTPAAALVLADAAVVLVAQEVDALAVADGAARVAHDAARSVHAGGRGVTCAASLSTGSAIGVVRARVDAGIATLGEAEGASEAAGPTVARGSGARRRKAGLA